MWSCGRRAHDVGRTAAPLFWNWNKTDRGLGQVCCVSIALLALAENAGALVKTTLLIGRGGREVGVGEVRERCVGGLMQIAGFRYGQLTMRPREWASV